MIELAILSTVYLSIICHGSVSSRSDRVGDALETDNAGVWGDWSQEVFCNEGYYGVGFKLRVEGNQGGGDDTAGNSFRLICDDGQEVIADKEGPWGDWSGDMVCPYAGSSSAGYITGFKQKVEGNQGGGDDTALNSVSVLCSDGTDIAATNGGAWGEWGSGWTQCEAAKTSVCGFKQRVEGNQGGGDDTALNAVALICCQNRRVISRPIGYWSMVTGIGNGQLTVTTSYGVTNHKEEELTTEFGASITATAEVSVGIEGIGDASFGLSATASTSLTQSTISSYTTTTETSLQLTCDEGSEAMYQWVTKMNEDSMTSNVEFEIKSTSYWCVNDDSLVPQCPFGFCNKDADVNCQICDEFEKQDFSLFELGLTLADPAGVTATDIGQAAFNNLFHHSTQHILYRYCADCFGAWKHVYYKRHTLVDSIDLYSLTTNWVSTNNVLGTDFDLYSTLVDAISGENAWTFCDYDDANVGMFRNCGPNGAYYFQWSPAKAAAFYIYQPVFPTPAPTNAPTTFNAATGSSSDSTVMIMVVAIVIAVILLISIIACIICCIYCCCRRKLPRYSPVAVVTDTDGQSDAHLI